MNSVLLLQIAYCFFSEVLPSNCPGTLMNLLQLVFVELQFVVVFLHQLFVQRNWEIEGFGAFVVANGQPGVFDVRTGPLVYRRNIVAYQIRIHFSRQRATVQHLRLYVVQNAFPQLNHLLIYLITWSINSGLSFSKSILSRFCKSCSLLVGLYMQKQSLFLVICTCLWNI